MSNLEKLEKKLLHYVNKAISDYNMIRRGDRVMVCVSGGKDSLTLLHLLHMLRRRSGHKFEVFSYTLDQGQPAWDDDALRAWLAAHDYPYEIVRKDTYSTVVEKTQPGHTYCALCSRLRRGTIYGYAGRHGYNKIALGHHRDDLIRSLLMAIFYNGEIRSMPPKLLTDDHRHIVIRPLVYCQEEDIAGYAEAQAFPIIPCNLCGSQENLARERIKKLIVALAGENPKIPSNMLHALQSLHPSQLMDKSWWNFRDLEESKDTEEKKTGQEVTHTGPFL